MSIDREAFGNTDEKLVIRYFSYVPIKVNENAFDGISVDATLIIPEHTKLIFENAAPWNLFNNIIEMPLNQTSLTDDSSVSDEEWARRIQSIYSSKNNANIIYIKYIIDSIKENYLKICDENEYKEAVDLLCYNYSFVPAIEQDLASEVCRNWPNKYKLLILNSDLGISQNIFVGKQYKTIAKDSRQELTPVSIPMELPELDSIDYEVYFTDIQRHLQNELSLAKDSVKIAVSWFTNYSLFKQIKKLSEKNVKVQILTNNDLINNGGYCLNFNELITSGVEISLVEYPHLLHDKFCIIDDSVIINGSYNWTRFSHNNYENIMIIRGNNELCQSFNSEFESLLQKAEYKVIGKMPNVVPDRPEYDRSAFRQYITEELDLEARETSDERDKLTSLQKAKTLNEDYLTFINNNFKKNVNKQGKIKEIPAKELDQLATSNAINENLAEIEKLQVQKKNLINNNSDILTSEDNSDAGQALQQLDQQIANRKKAIDTIKSTSSIITQGGRGALKINLKWSTKDDLDLHVIDPDNQEIFFRDKKKMCQGYLGQLDIDANAGSNLTSTPQENIYWEGKAPLGNYKVKVVYYAQHDNKKEIYYTVSVYPENGEPKTFTGSMHTPKEEKCVVEFKITEDGILYL